jgi:hypothetical protein
VLALENSAKKSAQAARAGSIGQASQGASSAFGKAKPDSASLDGVMERESNSAGTQLGNLDQDLKRNDPSLNKKAIKPPEPKAENAIGSSSSTAAGVSEDDKIKMMIVQMMISSILGPVFGAIGNMMASAITGEVDTTRTQSTRTDIGKQYNTQ